MATARLPAAPNLENLKNRAKSLLAAYRDGDAQAAADFAELHPRQTPAGDAQLTDAQLVLARSYGQLSWQQLAIAVEVQLATRVDGPADTPRVNQRNVRSFLRSVAPDLAVDDLQLVSGRYGNSLLFHDGDDRLVRVPKSNREALLKEARLFEHLGAQQWSMRFPRTHFVHAEGLYAVYERVAGTQLTTEVVAALTPAQLSAAISAIADFFSALHAHAFPADIRAMIPQGDDPWDVQVARLRRKIGAIAGETTQFDTDAWATRLDQVEAGLQQRWEVIHCDPQVFHFHAVNGDFGQLMLTQFSDALIHDPGVDLGDFLADLSRDLPADSVLSKQIRELLLAGYETDDPGIIAKVDFGLLSSEVRWAHIGLRAAQKHDAGASA